jgi:hypothetical protein
VNSDEQLKRLRDIRAAVVMNRTIDRLAEEVHGDELGIRAAVWLARVVLTPAQFEILGEIVDRERRALEARRGHPIMAIEFREIHVLRRDQWTDQHRALLRQAGLDPDDPDMDRFGIETNLDCGDPLCPVHGVAGTIQPNPARELPTDV